MTENMLIVETFAEKKTEKCGAYTFSSGIRTVILFHKTFFVLF